MPPFLPNRPFGHLASLLLFAMGCLLHANGVAQTGMQRMVLQVVDSDTVKLDSLSLVPGSLQVWALPALKADSLGSGSREPEAPATGSLPAGASILAEGEVYSVDAVCGALIFEAGLRPKAIYAIYRVFPIDLSRTYAHKDRAGLDSLGVLAAPLRYTVPRAVGDGDTDLGGLDYSGSFSRGLSFGNRQDVVLNSSLNLQLAGTFREVSIEAAITDNNIPVQPEGNTQQLQEFDQVYIRLRRDPHQLTVGDYELRRPDQAYFLNLFRRLQGAQYRGSFGRGAALPGMPPGGDGRSPSTDPGTQGAAVQAGRVTVGASAAVARGQYRRQFLVPEEGNQGPYLLRGNNNERFIIVLAGSERVYIDGELLLRGEENDYVVDYNSGELTFTPNRIVTKDLRIQVEFEYAERSYFRSLFITDGHWAAPGGKLDLRWNFYSEQDGRNQPVDATLGDAEIDALQAAGDSLSQALAPSFDTATFDPDRILYRLVDTLGFDSVFVYSTSSEVQLYQVGFSLVGEQMGNYQLASSLANGRVYEWVAPIAGVPQGDYEPVRLVPAPLSRQILSIGTQWRPFANGEITGEWALSRLDQNTFSPRDDGDDAGMAGVLGFRQRIPLGKGKRDSLGSKTTGTGRALLLDARYEWAGERFRPLENYRPVEFSRDWNLGLVPAAERQEERWLTSGISYEHGSGKRIAYRLDRFRQGNPQAGEGYSGWRQGGNAAWQTGGFRASGSVSYLSATTDSARSSFLRPRLDLRQAFGRWAATLHGEVDDIRFRRPGSDSLTAATIYYDLLQVRLARDDSSTNRYGLTYRLRRDKGPNGEDLQLAGVANEFILDGRLQPGKGQRLQWTLTGRDLRVLDTVFIREDAERALLGRLEYGFAALKGLFQGDLLYELGTASEPRRNFAYVQVPAGQGQYTWNDYNENGVAELDEFEQAVFQDLANYIRVFTPTDEFVRADVLNAQYSVGFNPKARWPSAEGLAAFFTRFSAQSIAQLNRRLLEGAGAAAYWPPATNFPDSNLVSLTSVLRNTVWFNRSRPDFGMEYTLAVNRGRNLLNGGPEDRRNQEHEAVLRAALGKRFNLRVEARAGFRRLDSEAFVTRSYDLPFWELAPRINYQVGTTWRSGFQYTARNSENNLGVETLVSHEAALDARWNRVGKSSLDGSVSLVLVDYNGAADSPVAFALLEGLQDGSNWLWRLNWDRKLSRFLQLGLQYEGRKTGSVPIAHVGRAQLRAIF